MKGEKYHHINIGATVLHVLEEVIMQGMYIGMSFSGLLRGLGKVSSMTVKVAVALTLVVIALVPFSTKHRRMLIVKFNTQSQLRKLGAA